MGVTQEASGVIKDYIRSSLKDNNPLILNVLNQMEMIIQNLKVQMIAKRRKGYWDREFDYQIGNYRYDFSVLDKENQDIKFQLNTLQSLIDILGSILTGRDLTQLSAYFITGKKTYHVLASPSQFLQIQQASRAPLTISIQAIRNLANQGLISIEEDSRLLKSLSRTNEGNKGHRTEAHDIARTTQKYITQKSFNISMAQAQGRTSWNKKGDNMNRQVKYLGTEGQFYYKGQEENFRGTASLVSIEEISTYFLTKLKPQINNIFINNNDLEPQVNAIYNAFVDAENLQFYGKGFDTIAIEELLNTIKAYQ